MALIIWTTAKSDQVKSVLSEFLDGCSVNVFCTSTCPLTEGLSPGDVVLAMGEPALDYLRKEGLVPKGRSISSLHGNAISFNGAHIILTYSPGSVGVDYTLKSVIGMDAKLAARLAETGTTKPVIGEYELVESLHELIDHIESSPGVVRVSCDLETKGLDPYNPEAWIIACSFSYRKGHAYTMIFSKSEVPRKHESNDYWSLLWDQINFILTSPKVSIRGANFKYDMLWLDLKWGIRCTNYKMDTVLVGSILDENRSNSLKAHAKLYTDMGGYDDDINNYDKGSLDEVPTDLLKDYIGGDTDATLRIADVFAPMLLQDTKLSSLYVKILHKANVVFVDLEKTGVYVDLDYMDSLRNKLNLEIDHIRQQIFELFPKAMHDKYGDGLSLTKSSVISDYMFSKLGLNLKPKMTTAKSGAPSTAAAHLMMFEEVKSAEKFLALYKEHTSAVKTLSTYVDGFLNHVRSDGRYHPTYILYKGDYGGNDDSGTTTGRTSCKDPPMQTVPKKTKWSKPLRRSFVAPEGMCILSADYSQGELRIAACEAKEDTMLEAYANDEDIHIITSAEIAGMTIQEFLALPEDDADLLRRAGKSANFGLIYGMQAKGYREYARTNFRVNMTLEEATIKRDRYFKKYKKLLPWHDRSVSFAKEHGYVRSFLGRIRHLPMIYSFNHEVASKAERQAINSKVQSCLSDMLLYSMVLFTDAYGTKDALMFLMVHDSMSMYVPENEAHIWGARLKEVMENLPLEKEFGWTPPILFKADVEVSVPDENGVHSMAKMKKLVF